MKLKFDDVVKREYDPKIHERRVTFPTICGCSGCGGYSGICYNGGVHKDPELAYKIALVQFGHSTIRNFDNAPPSHPCNCEQRLKELKGAVSKLSIKSDTGWNLDERTSILSRGIRDYHRVIVFERDLTSDEMNDFKEFLQRDKCPGWTGIQCRCLPDGAYRFTTTWDSSD